MAVMIAQAALAATGNNIIDYSSIYQLLYNHFKKKAMSNTLPAPHAPGDGLMRNTNFRWLLGGGLVSMPGDQFSMLALSI